MVGNDHFVSRVRTNHLPSMNLRLGLREFIVLMLTYHYPPTIPQQNYFLLVQQCFKIVRPPANPPFRNGFLHLPAVAQLSMHMGNLFFMYNCNKHNQNSRLNVNF